MNTATNVTTGKPAVGGAIYVETTSSATLPTGTDSALTGFTSLGFVSDSGLTNANTFDSTAIKEWGGATVLTIEDNYTDTFKFTLIEALNADVLKEVFGSANVTGALASGISVSVKPTQHTSKKWVIDMIMRDGVLKRICIPAGAVSAVSEITYSNTAAVGYEVTVTAMADATGVTHYEYIKKPA